MKKEGVPQDPLIQIPLGRMEVLRLRAERERANIEKARQAQAMPEGEERDRALSQIRLSLQNGDSVRFSSGGMGSGERHTKQSTPNSETIL